MKHDMCSVMLGGKRIFSYMSQAIGMMADVDLGRVHLRLKTKKTLNEEYRYGTFAVDGRHTIPYWLCGSL